MKRMATITIIALVLAISTTVMAAQPATVQFYVA